MAKAIGTFEVTVKPETLSDVAAGAGLGRMSLDKRYQGPLEATSQGEMLSAMGTRQGSAGYVAIERVTGVLGGRSGSFFLQHSGTMTRGTPTLGVSVVPDSGSGQLAGLSGMLHIRVEDGRHFYDFDYQLAEPDGVA
ncbi:MAG: DUF3224 domain-containing protein [Pseudomonadota bacterium]